MYKHLDNSQRLRFGYIHYRHSRAVPASAVQARSLSAECCPGMFLLGYPPSLHQEKTPYSRRPIRFSTSRAPGSVLAYLRGIPPPSAFFGVVSHWTAEATSSSNSSTAFSKALEIRNRRSDSSGANLPAVLRRARVRSGIPRIDTSSADATPELASNFRGASKENPASNCSINSGVPALRIPRLAPRLTNLERRAGGGAPPWEGAFVFAG